MSIRARNSSRAERARLTGLVAAIALLPAIAGCSSSSSVEYITDAYPSRSLVDLVKESTASPPPVQRPDAAPPPAMATAPAPPAVAPPTQVAPAAAPVAEAAPAPSAAPREEADPVAAAYPSVSLIDLVTGGRKPAQ